MCFDGSASSIFHAVDQMKHDGHLFVFSDDDLAFPNAQSYQQTIDSITAKRIRTTLIFVDVDSQKLPVVKESVGTLLRDFGGDAILAESEKDSESLRSYLSSNMGMKMSLDVALFQRFLFPKGTHRFTFYLKYSCDVLTVNVIGDLVSHRVSLRHDDQTFDDVVEQFNFTSATLTRYRNAPSGQYSARFTAGSLLAFTVTCSSKKVSVTFRFCERWPSILCSDQVPRVRPHQSWSTSLIFTFSLINDTSHFYRCEVLYLV